MQGPLYNSIIIIACSYILQQKYICLTCSFDPVKYCRLINISVINMLIIMVFI